jgi:hypothetical protein
MGKAVLETWSGGAEKFIKAWNMSAPIYDVAS